MISIFCACGRKLCEVFYETIYLLVVYKEGSNLKTRVFHPENGKNEINEAADILRSGGLLGIPTETVYGLGANALNEDAVLHIFQAKGRPQDNPLILHVPDVTWLERYCAQVPDTAYRLAEAFWPGPLTMILPRRPIVPLRTTGGLDTVGVRCPDHPVTRAIIRAAGVPVAAPSGNTSGRPSPTNAADMLEDMDGKIDGIVDGGPCRVGVESTIIDLTVTPPRLLRPGGLPLEDLRRILGEVAVDKAVTQKVTGSEPPRAPGMKYRHYAPHAPVTVVAGAPTRSAAYIRAMLQAGEGVICFEEYKALFSGHEVQSLGASDDPAQQAHRVFDALRRFDSTSVTSIYAQCPDDTGLGLAVGNRLKKAAGFHIVDADRLPQAAIGLTGGTGSGKTSALRALERLGGKIIDCDAVYHRELRQNPALRADITAAFGDVFTGAELDRQKLGTVVFSDPAALGRLNEIVYFHLLPVIRREMQGHLIVGLDAINLFESGLAALCAATVGILAPREDRVRRIMVRDGITEDYARLRMAAQPPDEYYTAHCSHILENRAQTPQEFEVAAEQFFKKLIQEVFTHE